MTSMQLVCHPAINQACISDAFLDLLNSSEVIYIYTKDGRESCIKRTLARFVSPVVNKLLNSLPCCYVQDLSISIPDVSLEALEYVFNIVQHGVIDFNSVSVKAIQEVQEAAKILEINISDLEFVKRIDKQKIKQEPPQQLDSATDNFAVYDRTGDENLDGYTQIDINLDNQHIDAKSEYPDIDTARTTIKKINCNILNCEKLISSALTDSHQLETSWTPPPETEIMFPQLMIPLKKRKYAHDTDFAENSIAVSSTLSSTSNSPPSKIARNSEAEDISPLLTPPPEKNKEEIVEQNEKPGVRKLFEDNDEPSSSVRNPDTILHTSNDKLETYDDEWLDEKGKVKKTEHAKESDYLDKAELKHNTDTFLEGKEVDELPVIKNPEFQYIYKPFKHDKCGSWHSRVDDCETAPPHWKCGKRHSYFKNCDRTWLSAAEMENVASKWPTYKGKNSKMEGGTDATLESTFSFRMEHERFRPISALKELEYVYVPDFHAKCGKSHSRVDLCEASPPHKACGRRHSYAMECNGSWMSLRKFEMLALKWPTNHQLRKKSKYSKLNYANTENKPEEVIKSYMEMTEDEKRENTCNDWNFRKCLDCKFGSRKRHRCSKMISGENETKICWGHHREVDHDLKLMKESKKSSRNSSGLRSKSKS